MVGEGGEPNIVSLDEALKIARNLNLDLVEISPKAEPPVCKIIDYKKFLYEQKRKDKELKKNQSKVVVKEIRYGPNTDDHDFDLDYLDEEYQKEFSEEVFSMLRKEYEHMTSEEYLIEMFEANEYEFTAEGEMI